MFSKFRSPLLTRVWLRVDTASMRWRRVRYTSPPATVSVLRAAVPCRAMNFTWRRFRRRTFGTSEPIRTFASRLLRWGTDAMTREQQDIELISEIRSTDFFMLFIIIIRRLNNSVHWVQKHLWSGFVIGQKIHLEQWFLNWDRRRRFRGPTGDGQVLLTKPTRKTTVQLNIKTVDWFYFSNPFLLCGILGKWGSAKAWTDNYTQGFGVFVKVKNHCFRSRLLLCFPHTPDLNINTKNFPVRTKL